MSLLGKLVPAGVKHKAKLRIHAGEKYECPYCGYSSKDLESIGSDFPILIEKDVIGGGAREGGCFDCGSSDRERLLYAYLMHELEIEHKGKDLHILHVAPEKRLTKVLLTLGLSNYVCGDKFEDGYEYGDHVVNVDILDIKFDNNSFEIILCNHVLEHIPDDSKAMRELCRVLRPGGKAILQVPISGNTESTSEDFSITDPQERIKAFGQFDHVRIYGQDYQSRLEQAGFKVERLNLAAKYPRLGLNPKEDLFICSK